MIRGAQNETDFFVYDYETLADLESVFAEKVFV